jgi:hypothetical protein
VSARKLKHLRQRFMGLHAEITDIHNRLRGSLKVTEDLFYARIYRSAMELYGVREIDDLIGERLQVLTESYAMISDEVRYFRSHILEVAIFLLILIEVINAFIIERRGDELARCQTVSPASPGQTIGGPVIPAPLGWNRSRHGSRSHLEQACETRGPIVAISGGVPWHRPCEPL